MPDTHRRDVALVLSGGGINGILLELGFLRRLSETQLWPRVGWIYRTSAGALAGTMTALGRLDDLEEFLMGLEPQDAFRPRAVWQFPGGLHDYTLPTTVEERLGTPEELGDALAARRSSSSCTPPTSASTPRATKPATSSSRTRPGRPSPT